jgi:hypothetical protein
MTLSSMVVSRDWQEVSVLECILGGLHIDVDVETQVERAEAKLHKHKVDALIVDYDLSGSSRFLSHLSRLRHFPDHLPLVIMSGPRARRELDETGALFTFEKPISVEQAVRTLSAARNLILDGRLRYHRQHLGAPVSVTCKSRRRVHAKLINLSQGGIGIHSNAALKEHDPVSITFRLPGTRSTVKANGEIAWSDGRGTAGVRFLEMHPRQQRGLQLWLAQQYFAH